jgi:hypothetical protein
MRAAMRPYSIAVAALLLFTNLRMKVMCPVLYLLCTSTWSERKDLVQSANLRNGRY